MNLKAAAAGLLLLTAAYASADYYEDRLKETRSYLTDIKKTAGRGTQTDRQN
ncbi:MAG: hypothetical protein LRY50_03585 [Geovibrio sp.]|nr:hypothetical protein [Geovibrio sp.]